MSSRCNKGKSPGIIDFREAELRRTTKKMKFKDIEIEALFQNLANCNLNTNLLQFFFYDSSFHTFLRQHQMYHLYHRCQAETLHVQ